MKEDTALAHWSNAVEGLESAEILHNHGKYKRAVAEAYYAIEAAARASLATKDVHPKTRTGVWKALTNKMVHSGEMPTEMGSHPRRAVVLARVPSRRSAPASWS